MSIDAEMVDRAMSVIGSSGFAVMTKQQQSAFLSGMLLVSYDLLRSIEDDNFVRGWLEAALAGLPEEGPFLQVRKPS